MALLEVRKITKSFKDQCVINDVSIRFPNTGLVSITGESGCGKSTFLKCILGITKLDRGEIFYRNKKVKNFDRFRNEATSYIFQNYSLVSFFSPFDNIGINNRSGKNEAILKCAKEANIERKLKQDVKTLSGGEKQRIAIARSLVSSSSIILCDEPTGSLDKENAKAIMDLLKEISLRKLVIVVTHNKEHVSSYSDVILRIENGCVKEESVNETKSSNNIENKKYSLSLKYMLKMCFSIVKSQFRKILFSIVSLGLSLSFFLLSLNTYSSINSEISSNINNVLNYNLMNLSLINETKLENSNFTLLKNVRPNVNELELINDVLENNVLCYDLSPFIPRYPKVYKSEDKRKYIDKIEFVPYAISMHRYLKKGLNGDIPTSLFEMIANKKAMEIVNQESFFLDLSTSIDYKTKDSKIISDSFIKEVKVEIVGEYDEFSLIETPRIYYPYDYLESVTKKIKLPNLSKHFNDDLSLYDRLTYYTYDNDPYISYSLFLEIDDLKSVPSIYETVNKTNYDNNHFEMKNDSLEIISSFSNVFDAVYEVITIFIVITIIISILLLSLSLDSIVSDNKVDIGIMRCIGIMKKDLMLVYLFCSLFVGIAGLCFSLSFYSLGSILINKTLLQGLIVSIPSKISLRNAYIGLVLVVVITLISSLSSFNRINRMQLGEVMREE